MLKRSLTTTYAVQIYSALMGIVIVPIYISTIGAEQFGLIGFFIMLQGIIQILDAGVTGSIARLASVSSSEKRRFIHFQQLFTKVVLVFAVIALFFVIIGTLMSDTIIDHWLKSTLDRSVLNVSLLSMFTILAIRYLTGPFRGGLIGLEKHVQISAANFVFITLKFPGSLLVFYNYNNSISVYFIYQSILALVEFFAFALLYQTVSNKKKRLLSETPDSEQSANLKSVLFFSGQLSILTIAWIVVTQIDKLVLSNVMELKEYGYYSLAVSLSSAIILLSAPLSQVLMSRLTVLLHSKKNDEYVKLYQKVFKWSALVLITLGMFIYMYSHTIILLWTSDKQIARASNFYLGWLALGNVFSVLLTLIYLLQYSFGKIKLHLIVYGVYSLFLIPASAIIAKIFEGEGSVVFWCIHNAVLFSTWGIIVHAKYFSGLNTFLWFRVLIPAVVASGSTLLITKSILSIDISNKLNAFAQLSTIGLVTLAIVVFVQYLIENATYQNITLQKGAL